MPPTPRGDDGIHARSPFGTAAASLPRALALARAAALVLAVALVTPPVAALSQDPNNYDLEVDDDDLLELESLKSDAPAEANEAEATTDAAEPGEADADAAARRAEALSEELIDTSGLQEYRLGPGDRLSVVVFGQDDLSGELAVDGQGRISLPLIGQVRARNRTVNELQQIVTDLFSKDYLIDPRISIEVTNYRPFYIYGQVNKPGSYPYVSGMTVRQAIALAGGYTRRASEEPVSITRTTLDELINIEGYLRTVVLPGDTIEVYRRLF
jgi:polysaccharide export outer membrane protein